MQSGSAAPRALKRARETGGSTLLSVSRDSEIRSRLPSLSRPVLRPFLRLRRSAALPAGKVRHCSRRIPPFFPRLRGFRFLYFFPPGLPSDPRPGIGSYSVICSFISMPSRHSGVLLIGQYETLTSSSEGISHILSGSEVSLVR